jgi:hypothetical protein
MSCHSQDGCEACHSVSPTLLKRLQWATVNVDSALSGSVSAGNSRTFFTWAPTDLAICNVLNSRNATLNHQNFRGVSKFTYSNKSHQAGNEEPDRRLPKDCYQMQKAEVEWLTPNFILMLVARLSTVAGGEQSIHLLLWCGADICMPESNSEQRSQDAVYAITSFTNGEASNKKLHPAGSFLWPFFLLWVKPTMLDHLLCADHCVRCYNTEVKDGFWHQGRPGQVRKQPGRQQVISEGAPSVRAVWEHRRGLAWGPVCLGRSHWLWEVSRPLTWTFSDCFIE